MKKALMVISFIILTVAITYAQDQTIKTLQTESGKTIAKDPNDTIPKQWKTGGTFSLNIAQGSLSNWAAGGDEFSLSANTFINAHAFYKKDKNSWDNNVDFYLGYVKTTSLGTRKVDDRIDILSKYGYALNSKLNLSLLGNVRTQFFKGYSYPDATTKIYTSNLFAPAYVLLSPGLDYKPVPNLSIFVSPVTARWVLVKDTVLSTLYGLEAGKKSDFQFGAYVSINYTAQLGKVVTYQGKLDLFSNYRHNPGNIDLYMTNLFTAKLSKVLSATYSLAMIYDDDVRQFGPNKNSPRLQIQSLFGVGILVKL
ncbi:DUF3078 domain-containing protein [Panacibacter ginsenosidivorans]|uniref:DUF3078 domain-containing protein n=1 Tax=Panacibacter ginsenosidivorans TaxID=1813871 RepID=A0A5B8V9S9_9BACT|nr:DUF3078 domain-containing protein [Panacibacter ginsenosidivorans]QEC68184.1 DUF3078 domain-containing protein [Panacibacter ginsenosidivorans]